MRHKHAEASFAKGRERDGELEWMFSNQATEQYTSRLLTLRRYELCMMTVAVLITVGEMHTQFIR